jgi:hypothetical protein
MVNLPILPVFLKKPYLHAFKTQKILIMADVTLTAYNVKTKEKNVPIQEAVVSRTAKGGYIAKGHDGKGNKLTALLGEAKALAAIKAGLAKQDW